MFEAKEYLISSIEDRDRTPEDTVLEYIKVFTRWSKHCHSWIKDNKAAPEKLTEVGARNVLDAIRKKYCVSKNRQYSRSDAGHYYIGGASKVHPVIDYTNQLGRDTVEVYTKPNLEKRLKSHKFIVKKVGAIWKISAFSSDSGQGRWREEEI
ncbi:MAG: RhsIA family immunity protein [Pseudomonadales bacterium]|nr:RhsIA family immunity protein [Pseudomonadales bacterium]